MEAHIKSFKHDIQSLIQGFKHTVNDVKTEIEDTQNIELQQLIQEANQDQKHKSKVEHYDKLYKGELAIKHCQQTLEQGIAKKIHNDDFYEMINE